MPTVIANPNEYQSTVGLEDVYIAEVLEDSEDVYNAGVPEIMAPAIDGTIEPTINSKTQYANNIPFAALTQEGDTKVTLNVTGLPQALQAWLTGNSFDAASGRFFNHGGTPPYFALSFRSQKASGGEVYVQYLKGRFSFAAQDISTKTDTPDPKPRKLIYTAIQTTYRFAVDGSQNKGTKFVSGDTDTDNFDETGWFLSVQVPVVAAAPAFTVIYLPADAATGVLATANFTATFSNKIKTGTAGISLIRVSTLLPIANAITLDSTKKIITIDPTASLTAGAQYAVVLTGVKSIYNQTLADAVVDFTVAP